MSFSIQQENSNKSQLNKKSSTIVRRKYLSAWEKQPDAMYKTYVFDQLGERRENFLSWLYFKDNAMRCSLCEKHGKENIWCTVGNQIFQLYKIKEHKHKSEVHRHAEETELKISARTQPTWIETRAKQISKQEQAVQNLILASIHICRQYQSLNSLEQLCVLLEKLGVQLLPSQISGVNYRNNDVALSFLQHVAYYLHEELIEKIKSSPAIESGKPVIIAAVSKLETTIGKIYNYFGRSSTRQQMLKEWQNFLDMPELKFKRIYDIRWSSIRGCIKPIIQNVQPGNDDLIGSNIKF
ncbi:unnamed protein product [Rotaria sp. Silwood1]|nr:unnamed protein product [Rotaria sp. Silwood1]